MSETAQKCENCAIFEQNYTLELFVAFKTVNSCCFGSRGNLDFPDFLQNSFITSTTEDVLSLWYEDTFLWWEWIKYGLIKTVLCVYSVTSDKE